MANDYELNQGELLKITLNIQDSDCNPVKIASVAGTGEARVYTPLIFFAGTATLEGQSPLQLSFKMQQEENITYGRGVGRTNDSGVFKVDAYLPADTTIDMVAGAWSYEIRESIISNPSDDQAVSTVLEGTITIIDGALDNADGAAFLFDAPDTPQ